MLPNTLQEWRGSGWKPEGALPRDVWDPLEEFFRGHGLILWNKSTNSSYPLASVPPNDLPRCPDGFAYTTEHTDKYPFYNVGHVVCVCVISSS
jgi:hypothetical protein